MFVILMMPTASAAAASVVITVTASCNFYEFNTTNGNKRKRLLYNAYKNICGIKNSKMEKKKEREKTHTQHRKKYVKYLK